MDHLYALLRSVVDAGAVVLTEDARDSLEYASVSVLEAIRHEAKHIADNADQIARESLIVHPDQIARESR